MGHQWSLHCGRRWRRQERRRLTRWHSGIYSSERRSEPSEPSEPSDVGRPEILLGSLQDVSTSRFSENLPIWSWILSNHMAPVSTASPDPKLGSSSQHGVLKPMEILCPSVSYTLHLMCQMAWTFFWKKTVTWGPLLPNKKNTEPSWIRPNWRWNQATRWRWCHEHQWLCWIAVHRHCNVEKPFWSKLCISSAVIL